MKIESYKNLTVWQKSMDLAVKIYDLTGKFPKSELYGLVSQMRRAAISIPSNLAEGSRRGSRKDFRHFVLIAFASGSEIETQLELSQRMGFISLENGVPCIQLLNEIMRMLNGLSKNLQ